MKNKYGLAFQAIFAILAFALTPNVIKLINIHPVSLGLGRIVLATSILAFFSNPLKQLFRTEKQKIPALVLLGLVFSVHWVTYFYAVKLSTPTIAMLGISTYGIFLLLFSWVFGIRQPSRLDFISVFLAVGGALLVVPEFSFENEYTIGLLVALFSSLMFSFIPIIQKKNSEVPLSLRAFSQYFFAMPLFICLSGFGSVPTEGSQYIGLIFLGVVCTVLAHTFWINITTKLPTNISSSIYYFTLPFTFLFSYLMFDDTIYAKQLLGAALIIGGNLLLIKK